jgi:hypothetical protein
MLRRFPSFVLSRPDVDLMVAMYAPVDEAIVREELQVSRSETQLDSPVLHLPGGLDHPLVQRLGIQSAGEAAVLVDKQGRILMARSGLSFSEVESSFRNAVTWQDELAVREALERGDVEAARSRIMALAPPYDPEAVDDRGRKLRKPNYDLAHLRARARVYMALEEWDKALADAEQVVERQLSAAGGMSLRTDELDQSEALRDRIRELMAKDD